MALSITIMPNVLGYIEELLYLQIPTYLYKQPLNCPNIVQMVVSITKPDYHELDFLVLKIGLISKTIVFVNNIDNVVKIVTYLCLLLLPKDRD